MSEFYPPYSQAPKPPKTTRKEIWSSIKKGTAGGVAVLGLISGITIGIKNHNDKVEAAEARVKAASRTIESQGFGALAVTSHNYTGEITAMLAVEPDCIIGDVSLNTMTNGSEVDVMAYTVTDVTHPYIQNEKIMGSEINTYTFTSPQDFIGQLAAKDQTCVGVQSDQTVVKVLEGFPYQINTRPLN